MPVRATFLDLIFSLIHKRTIYQIFAKLFTPKNGLCGHSGWWWSLSALTRKFYSLISSTQRQRTKEENKKWEKSVDRSQALLWRLTPTDFLQKQVFPWRLHFIMLKKKFLCQFPESYSDAFPMTIEKSINIQLCDTNVYFS